MPGEMSWTYDAPDGVYKNHVLSGELLKAAAKKFTFVPFTQKVNDFGAKQGQTVNLFYYKPVTVPSDGTLREDQRIPIDRLVMASRAITVSEWGRGLQYTNLNEQLSAFNPKDEVQSALIEQMEAVMDAGAAAAFKTGKICAIPTGAGAITWDTDGTPSTQATVNIDLKHMGVIRDYLANDLHCPFFESGNYIGLFTTKALRGLKGDNAITLWHQYLRKGDLLFNSEIGKVENIRLIEVNNEQSLSNGVGSSSVLGEAVVFGDKAVARAEVDYPHLRADPNYQSDFGRIKAVAWYGIVAFGTYFDTANDREARIIRVTSS